MLSHTHTHTLLTRVYSVVSRGFSPVVWTQHDFRVRLPRCPEAWVVRSHKVTAVSTLALFAVLLTTTIVRDALFADTVQLSLPVIIISCLNPAGVVKTELDAFWSDHKAQIWYLSELLARLPSNQHQRNTGCRMSCNALRRLSFRGASAFLMSLPCKSAGSHLGRAGCHSALPSRFDASASFSGWTRRPSTWNTGWEGPEFKNLIVSVSGRPSVGASAVRDAT